MLLSIDQALAPYFVKVGCRRVIELVSRLLFMAYKIYHILRYLSSCSRVSLWWTNTKLLNFVTIQVYGACI